MKLGICAGFPDPIGATAETDTIHIAAELGYDYIEMPLTILSELSETDFTNLLHKLDDERLRCECLNMFFPAKIRLTGDDVADKSQFDGYLRHALDRARKIGASIIVFGSSRTRNIPEGYPYDKAFEQLVHVLGAVSDAISEYGFQIAIESLNHNESNIILNLADADKLMTAVGRPNIKILLDYYHFALESDSVELLKRLMRDNKIIHMHIADPVNRAYPTEAKQEFCHIFDILRAEGYAARCSIEANLKNPKAPREEMEIGLATMREITKNY